MVGFSQLYTVSQLIYSNFSGSINCLIIYWEVEILLYLIQKEKLNKLKNIHEFTNSLARNQQVNIILTTNNDPTTGNGEEEDDLEVEREQEINDSCSTNDSMLDKEEVEHR